jgi:SAM-dependent methyltransferase
MYKTLKSVIKKLIPQRLLINNEALIRKGTYFLYKGNTFQCNTCDARLSKFVHLDTDDLLCPRCGSLPRTRRLWTIVEPLLADHPKILHFSPSRTLFRKLKNRKDIEYLSTDYEDEFLADQKLDIRSTGLAANSFDLVICFHVLEHIDEDLKAMQELLRILKPGGQCLIQTPFKEGEIYENKAIIDPADRLVHFGQADHVRIYSVAGLKNRLENTGFVVDIQLFENEINNRFGYKEKEVVLQCSAP